MGVSVGVLTTRVGVEVGGPSVGLGVRVGIETVGAGLGVFVAVAVGFWATTVGGTALVQAPRARKTRMIAVGRAKIRRISPPWVL
jgi:hypothetical protein